VSDRHLPPSGAHSAEDRTTPGHDKREKAAAVTAPPRASATASARTPTPDAAVYEGLADFRFALRQFLAFSEVIAAVAGVTSQQYQAMLAISVHRGGPIMMKDLAEQMLLVPNGAVQLVDRLAAAGLVERQPSTADRRSVLVALTAEGEGLLARMVADHSTELLKNEPLLAESLARLREIGQRRNVP
jgi:DNA-binding MarR family transcriptional regulator